MTFDEYQSTISDFAVYPEHGTGSKMELAYLALGLTGEAGEAAEKIKKYIRDDKLDPKLVILELGDVLWYLTMLTKALKYPVNEVAYNNIVKLTDRKARNVLSGNGDIR